MKSCKIPLTLAGVTSEQIKVILSIAQNLQNNYDRLNVAPTQNVRNPLPMRTLILTMVPRNPKDAITRAQLAAKIRSAGYAVGEMNFRVVCWQLTSNGVLVTDDNNKRSEYSRFYMRA